MRIVPNIGVNLSLVVLLCGLVACDSPSTRGGAEAEGRTRLSVNQSNAEFGDYVVHVNALTTASLTPEVAQLYGITRSENRGMVNLVVLQKTSDAAGTRPVRANVELTAANLTGQVKSIAMQEVIDSESIYYTTVVSVDDLETINFDFDIQPEASSQNLPVRFTHKFYER